LEKVLQQGDITECAEPYLKDAENPKVSLHFYLLIIQVFIYLFNIVYLYI